MKAITFIIGLVLFILGMYTMNNWAYDLDQGPWYWQRIPEGLPGLLILTLGIILIDKGAVPKKERERRKTKKKL